MERAFRFLKSASVSCGGDGDGVDVGAGDDGVAVAAEMALAVLRGGGESGS